MQQLIKAFSFQNSQGSFLKQEENAKLHFGVVVPCNIFKKII